MKSTMFFLLALVAVSPVSANEVSPIEKVIQMLSELEAKVIGEGKDAQKTYELCNFPGGHPIAHPSGL